MLSLVACTFSLSMRSLCTGAIELWLANDFLTMSAPKTQVDFRDRKTTERLGRKEPNMLIIGCDYHPSFQQIAFVDTGTGDYGERRLEHMEEADQFYLRGRVAVLTLAWTRGAFRSKNPESYQTDRLGSQS